MCLGVAMYFKGSEKALIFLNNVEVSTVSTKFGVDSFLTRVPETSGGSTSENSSTPDGGPRTTPSTRAQPIVAVMAALKPGPKSMRDIILLVGNNVSVALEALEKLVELGYATRSDGDVYTLTQAGQQAATSL